VTAGHRVPRAPGAPDAQPPLRRGAPLPLAAAVTTVWAALVSAAPVLAVVLLAHLVDRSGAPVRSLLRFGLAGWLLAHGTPMATPIGPIGLAPLMVTALAAWRVYRAGVHTARAIGGRRTGRPAPALAAGAAVAVAYGLLGAAAAAVADSPGLHIAVPRAMLTMAGFGLVAGLGGALAETGTLGRLARRTPRVVRDAVRTGLVAAALLLGAGALAAGTALAVAGGEASAVLSAYRTGVAGQAGLTLLCLVYAPNLAVWATSYLLGPGFAVGAGTTVSAARVSLGALPAVPAFAGLPTRPLPGWGSVLLGVPLAAGMVAGWLLARRWLRTAGPAASWVELLGAAALGGPVAGGAVALAAFASGGPLGGGRLAQVGPAVLPTAGAAAALAGLGALVAAAATRSLVGVRRKPA
jgi:Family of unknown function (DUF6350)